jgi:uncharacterized membrane protein
MTYISRRVHRAQREVASGGSAISIGRLITGIGLGVLVAVTVAANLKDIQHYIKTSST